MMDNSFDDFDADAVSKALEEQEAQNGTPEGNGDSSHHNEFNSTSFSSKNVEQQQHSSDNDDLFKTNDDSEDVNKAHSDVENDEEKESGADSSKKAEAADDPFADFVGYQKPSETKKPAVDLDSDFEDDDKKAAKSDDEDEAPKEKAKKADFSLAMSDDDDKAPKSQDTKRKSEAAAKDTSTVDAKDNEDEEEEKDDELAAQEREEDAEIAAEEAYFKGLSEEEKEWHQENGPRPESLVNKPITCTACFKPVTAANAAVGGICRHPALSVAVCRACRTFYGSGEWEKDEDGFDQFCRWCGQGGELVGCDKCPNSICRKCLQRNLGRSFLANATNQDEWMCLLCDPRQIYKLRADFHILFVALKETREKERREKEERRKQREKTAKAEPKKPESFVDEALEDCFSVALSFQREVENVRAKWARNKNKKDADVAADFAKNIIKALYTSVSNIELLGKSVANGFKTEFPNEDDSKVEVDKSDISGDLEAVRKMYPSARKKINIPKSAAGGKMNGSVAGGDDDSDDDDDDDSDAKPKRGRKPAAKTVAKRGRKPAAKTTTPKRKAPTPAAKTSTGKKGKVSATLFSRGKAKSKEIVVSDSDSDSDDEKKTPARGKRKASESDSDEGDYSPKKRAAPVKRKRAASDSDDDSDAAPTPAKRPGPKSKTAAKAPESPKKAPESPKKTTPVKKPGPKSKTATPASTEVKKRPGPKSRTG